MKLIILIIAIMLASASGFAQQLHFAYLQTDTHQPFYVTLNQRNYSSSSAGYIILPKLQNGDYPVRVGFAKNTDTEQEFLLQVKDNDQGFLIKNFGDKGWGLFNLQTMAVQYAGTAAQERAKLAAAQKAEADQRQRKLDEELQAAATQRRNDSLKILAIAQQAYTDSMATVAAASRQRSFDDSVAKTNIAALQARYADSVANAKALAKEAERLEKIAKADASAQASAIKKQKAEIATDADAKAKALAKENERLEKIADSSARAQTAALEKQKAKTLAEEKLKARELAKESERLEKTADSTTSAQAATAEKEKLKEEAAKKEATAKAIKPPEKVAAKKIEKTKIIQPPVLIQRLFTDSGWYYAYNVTNFNQREKVEVFIPSAQPKLPVTAVAVEEKTVIPVDVKEIMPATTEKKDSIKFPDISIGQDTATTLTVQVPKDTVPATPAVPNADTTQPIIADNTGNQTAVTDTTPVATEKSILNANCKAVANEKDFLAARRKIASVFGTDAMLAAARKLLKDKCYTIEQLRNLCVLFLTDEGRYQFLDAAYPYAFDAYRYSTLQDLLIDTYYVQRFKTMLR